MYEKGEYGRSGKGLAVAETKEGKVVVEERKKRREVGLFDYSDCSNHQSRR